MDGQYYADPEHMLDQTGDEAHRWLAGLPVGQRFTYWYDFGADWWHDIQVESVDRADPAVDYPRCVAGRRSCPPEDCGGPLGYEELIRALGDSTHPQHMRYRDWMQELGQAGYDPTHCDLDEINEVLARHAHPIGALQR